MKKSTKLKDMFAEGLGLKIKGQLCELKGAEAALRLN